MNLIIWLVITIEISLHKTKIKYKWKFSQLEKGDEVNKRKIKKVK
jgi:hypothetical protein